jgi:hypothetical protein
LRTPLCGLAGDGLFSEITAALDLHGKIDENRLSVKIGCKPFVNAACSEKPYGLTTAGRKSAP